MKTHRILLAGGTGFVGRHLAARLVRDGHSLVVPTRNLESAQAIGVLPSTRVVAADIHDATRVRELLRGCDVAINLVGILNEQGRSGHGFRRAHVELTQTLLDACQAAGVRRYIHMSSLRADAKDGPSHYLRSKGEAEASVRSAKGIDWTVFQPSVIFGPDDSFTQRFAGLLRVAPVFPLARPNARFAPVYIGDVAAAFANAVSQPSTIGKTLQLCGPKVYSLRELIAYIRATTRSRGVTIGLPDPLARLQARVFELLPGKPFSMDNYRSLTVNSICEQNGFKELGLKPRALEAIMPSYLGSAGRNARLSMYRRSAGR